MSLISDLRILYHLTVRPVRGKDHAARMESFYAGQAAAYDNVGRDLLTAAGLAAQTTLIEEASSIALARLAGAGLTADAAFVDGSHRFHEVFVDLYFLRILVRPGGLIILDDAAWPSVAAALRYFDRNLGWQPVSIEGRLAARRLPDELLEPAFTDFKPF